MKPQRLVLLCVCWWDCFVKSVEVQLCLPGRREYCKNVASNPHENGAHWFIFIYYEIRTTRYTNKTQCEKKENIQKYTKSTLWSTYNHIMKSTYDSQNSEIWPLWNFTLVRQPVLALDVISISCPDVCCTECAVFWLVEMSDDCSSISTCSVGMHGQARQTCTVMYWT